jgi:hypothetical protein
MSYWVLLQKENKLTQFLIDQEWDFLTEKW